MSLSSSRIVDHSEVLEGLLDGSSFVDRASLPVVARFTSSHGYATKLLAVGDPRTLRDEAMLANDPLLNFLIGGLVMLGVGHLRAYSSDQGSSS